MKNCQDRFPGGIQNYRGREFPPGYMPRINTGLGYCNVSTPPAADLFAIPDDALFSRITYSCSHVRQSLLPDHSSHHYNPRNRRH